MASLDHNAAADDFTITTVAEGAQNIGEKLATMASATDAYIRTVPTDFASLDLAIADFEISSARKAIIFVRGAVPAMASADTLTKPMEVVGEIEFQ